ncbi:hypothetical protein KC351_g10052 [Hortaea werneckii]|nr:hypothetical protein KC351_g10052 [Hortaea werneckii]
MPYRHDYPTLVAAKRRPAGRGPGTPPPRWILAAPPQDTPSGLQLWNVFVKRALRWLAKCCGAERVKAMLAGRKRKRE